MKSIKSDFVVSNCDLKAISRALSGVSYSPSAVKARNEQRKVKTEEITERLHSFAELVKYADVDQEGRICFIVESKLNYMK